VELDRIAEHQVPQGLASIEDLEMNDETACVAHRALHLAGAGETPHGGEDVDGRHVLEDSATLSDGVRWFSAVLLALMLLLSSTRGSASSALELVRIAKAHELAREDDIALRRYMEALALDPTCDEAYLGLGSLRARRGDLREADRVYSVALEHVPQLTAARTARAYVRRALGLRADAVQDLLTAAGPSEDPKLLRVLATWYGEDGQVPAQLAVWRRIAARAESSDDAVLAHEAKTMVRALVILVGPADPASHPADDRNPVRRAIAASTQPPRRR
jgi:tetratricopeptide (TPR) repeat protein